MRGQAMVKRKIGKKTGRESEQFQLRLPDGMRKDLARVAEREGRSMNAVIVTALVVYLEKEKREPLIDVEATIRELAADQHETLEILKKMIEK
jgi:hypothetical protein